MSSTIPFGGCFRYSKGFPPTFPISKSILKGKSWCSSQKDIFPSHRFINVRWMHVLAGRSTEGGKLEQHTGFCQLGSQHTPWSHWPWLARFTTGKSRGESKLRSMGGEQQSQWALSRATGTALGRRANAQAGISQDTSSDETPKGTTSRFSQPCRQLLYPGKDQNKSIK